MPTARSRGAAAIVSYEKTKFNGYGNEVGPGKPQQVGRRGARFQRARSSSDPQEFGHVENVPHDLDMIQAWRSSITFVGCVASRRRIRARWSGRAMIAPS